VTIPRAAWLLLAAVSFAACSEAPAPADKPPVAAATSLETVTLEPARVPRETVFDGVVEAVNQATVSAQTSGRVVELPFDVGDYVEKGEVIVRLRDTEQRARLTNAQAALAEAEARLAEAQRTYERIKDLYDKRFIAKAQFDRAEAELRSAQARVTAAEAAIREAREGLDYTVVRAPYSGIVVRRDVKLGESVAPGQPLMTGLSLEHLRVVVDVPQQHIGPLRRHRKARAILPGGKSVEVTGLRIPPAADPATHTFRVLATLPAGEQGANGSVLPGTLVKVAFVSGEEERLLLPPQAIVRRSEVTAVYVVDAEGRVAFRYVRVGTPAGDGRVPVLAGLEPGEKVAIDPIAAGIAYKRQRGGAA